MSDRHQLVRWQVVRPRSAAGRAGPDPGRAEAGGQDRRRAALAAQSRQKGRHEGVEGGARAGGGENRW